MTTFDTTTWTTIEPPARKVKVSIDGEDVIVTEGATVLDACRQAGVETPTLCYGDTLTPVNACRVCVVEVEGSRALVPACSREAEGGMEISTDSNRVRKSRQLVLELLGSSVNLELAGMESWMDRYGANAGRFGPPGEPAGAGERDQAQPGHHHDVDGATAATVTEPPRIDNALYMRDYAKCILCYKCVEACGEDAQNTFAIAVAGRGFEARISTEFAVELPDSACVFCGNCIGVCPTGALMPMTEWTMRQSGTWNEEAQTVTRTVCSFCGVGCNLELHVQDNKVVKATSPEDHFVTSGHLCIKGRFGWEHIQSVDD